MNAPAVADVFAREMAAAGTQVVFGLPGGGNNLEIVGALQVHGIQFVLTHGETSAAIMAAVHADVTGVPSAVVVTRGPGAASAVNGAAHALLDRQPVIIATDAVAQADRPRIAHQYIDQRSLYRAVTKGSGVLSGAETRQTMLEAIDLAMAHPRGPVHLDFDPTAPERVSPVPAGASAATAPGSTADLSAVLGLLAGASRPVVLLGVGARDAGPEVRRLLIGTDIPFLATYRAKGVVEESCSNYAGLLTGATIESALLDSADVILAVGLDTVELIPAGWPYESPVVSISSWGDDSGYIPAERRIVGPLAELVPALHGQLSGAWTPGTGHRYLRWSLAALRREPATLAGVSPQALVTAVRDAAPLGTPATVDAGAHMLPALPLWSADSRDEAIVSSGLATMGFALLAAIGAALAVPGRRVVCFVGDGGLGMVLAELETLARLDLPITVIVFNDSRLSLIAVKQSSARHGGEAAVAYQGTDFAQVAAGFGISSRVVHHNSELESVVAASLRGPGPSLVDARVDPGCYPLILDAVRGRRDGFLPTWGPANDLLTF
jgi:acetolactate synthase-1/2/3 large subunit